MDQRLEDKLDDIERVLTRIADSLEVIAAATEATASNTAPFLSDTITDLLWEIRNNVEA